MILKLFKFLFNYEYRKIILHNFNHNYISPYLLKLKIRKFLKRQPVPEMRKMVPFVKVKKLYPYEFTKKYSPKKIKVYKDSDCGLFYVLHNGKRLYARRNMKDKVTVQKWYNALICEQDKESPHCYLLNEDRFPLKNSVVAELGSAEGMFSLDVIEYVKKIYLFESNKEWMEALNHTFAPYKEKVEIVNRLVGDSSKGDMICLDDFFKDKEINYIKADIEGWEEAMLLGANRILNEKIKQIVLCVYHKQTSEKDITSFLTERGYNIDVNPHYMIFWYTEGFTGKPLEEPYLRHGVLYAEKNNRNN